MLDNRLPAPSQNDFRSYNPQPAVEGAPQVAGARPLTFGRKYRGSVTSVNHLTLAKFSLVLLTVGTASFVSWRSGYERGYDEGESHTGERYQIILDANVYWAHRSALKALEVDRSYAVAHELEALESRYKRLSEAEGSEAEEQPFIRINFLDRIKAQHAATTKRSEKLLDDLATTASTKPTQ